MSEVRSVENVISDPLGDAQSYFECNAAWEKDHIGQGGSEIAAGRDRRYADAIGAAIKRLQAADRLVACCETANKHDLILLPSAAAIGEACQLYREAK